MRKNILSQIFSPTIGLAMGLMAIIIMMILPVPSWVLDLGLAMSFAIAILIFTVTLFIERPLDFSAFPTLLLGSLMLRLSLNVSSTKLIIGQGHNGPQAAGNVIQGFANFIMGGSVFLGIVVFAVLMIVNFAVITKGAGRMAEVGARFALDAMPGKQLAIDADVAAGAITHEEAKVRRQQEQQETTFFGSLDGASKFVKGDAIAGLMITGLNLIVGLIMGAFVHGMDIGKAFETYAILTVGDGLVTQIPAVIISIAAALLLARGGNSGTTDSAVFSQIQRHPSALAAVGVLMAVFALVPGLPFVPFMLAAVCLGGLSAKYYTASTTTPEPAFENPEPIERPIGDILDLDDIHVEFASDLIPMILDQGTGLDVRIANMRKYLATHFGLILPKIRLTDDPSLPDGTYVIRVHGVEQASAQLLPNHVLVLLPEGDSSTLAIQEPVYGAPAKWVERGDQDQIVMQGMTIVTPVEVLATHLIEVLKRNFSRLLSLRALRRLLEELTNLSDHQRASANQKLFDDLVPDKVPYDQLLTILRALLDEHVSIRNLPLILETISEAGKRPIDLIVETVRQKLGFQIISALKREDGTIPLVQLAPEWEDTFNSYQVDTDAGFPDVALPPDIFHSLTDSIAENISSIHDKGISPALVTSTKRRRFINGLVRAKGLKCSVISFEEIGFDAKPALVGVIPA